jgi:hypothetical protein
MGLILRFVKLALFLKEEESNLTSSQGGYHEIKHQKLFTTCWQTDRIEVLDETYPTCSGS